MHDVIRQILGQALVAHVLTDQESEEAMLDQRLDAEQERLERLLAQLWDKDPIGMAAFGDKPEWLAKRLGDNG